MPCTSCKKTSEEIALEELSKVSAPTSFWGILKEYVVKMLIFFLLLLILTPFVIPLLIFVLFKVIVLSQGVNIMPMLNYIGKKIFHKEEPEDESEDEDEYELENPHDVVELK